MRRSSYLWDRAGAGAAEFALVLPVLMFLILGVINVFMATYAAVNLHSASETAARWASVTYASGTTPTQATVSAYAQSQYKGPNVGGTYVYSTNGTCGSTGSSGYQVTATGTYKVYYGFGTMNFPIATQACFPNQTQPGST